MQVRNLLLYQVADKKMQYLADEGVKHRNHESASLQKSIGKSLFSSFAAGYPKFRFVRKRYHDTRLDPSLSTKNR